MSDISDISVLLDTTNELIDELHYEYRDDLVYCDILYPLKTAQIVGLSTSDYQMRISPKGWSDLVNYTINKWIKNQSLSTSEYINILFDAIHKLKCYDGVFIRLNQDLKMEPTYTTIKRGDVTVEKMTGGMGNTERRNLIANLKKWKQYIDNPNTLYNKAAKILPEYTREQTLLSWIGYMLLKSKATTAILSENEARPGLPASS